MVKIVKIVKATGWRVGWVSLVEIVKIVKAVNVASWKVGWVTLLKIVQNCENCERGENCERCWLQSGLCTLVDIVKWVIMVKAGCSKLG